MSCFEPKQRIECPFDVGIQKSDEVTIQFFEVSTPRLLLDNQSWMRQAEARNLAEQRVQGLHSRCIDLRRVAVLGEVFPHLLAALSHTPLFLEVAPIANEELKRLERRRTSLRRSLAFVGPHSRPCALDEPVQILDLVFLDLL